MDPKLKQQLKDLHNDMYRSLTMLDTSLLVSSDDKYLIHLKQLVAKAEQCENILKSQQQSKP